MFMFQHEKGTTMAEPLFDRIGGSEAVFAAVTSFYDKVMADESLRPFFTHMDMGAQVDKQVAFLTMAFGGPSAYTGRDLRTAHAGLVKRGLADAHFNSVAQHLHATLEELAVPTELIDEVMDLVAGTRDEVLGR
jgi:hemoglobin